MKKIIWTLLLLCISGTTLSKDMTKIVFIADTSQALKEGLCKFDRFLECTEDSAELCRAQMEMIVVPHCIKKYEASIPDVLTETEAKETAKILQKCSLSAYVSFNQVNIDEFSACMAK